MMIQILLDLIHYEVEYDLFDRDPGDIRYTYCVQHDGRELKHVDIGPIDLDTNSVDVFIGDETYRISVEKLNVN